MIAEDPKVLSVADLSRRLRRAVEATATRVWVEGEVKNTKVAASGHVYFSLRDEREDALLDCVMYRTSALRVGRLIVDGARVEVRGSASFFVPRGRVQIVADVARPRGRGALLEALEALKHKLAAEGLFDATKKRRLPAEPKIIGIVTSASGAAVHDIARVAFRRGGARLLVARASVQGPTAPREIEVALDLLERVKGVDVIIVGRGGGASDDLSAFQDERVVRRIARCRVPVVSAVGHEIDVTLTDLVADLRAATPSQAAEMVVPERRGQQNEARRLSVALGRAMQEYLDECRQQVDRNVLRLGDPHRAIADARQAVDDLEARMTGRLTASLATARSDALRLAARIAARHPRASIAMERGELDGATLRLAAAMRTRIARERSAFSPVATKMSELPKASVVERRRSLASLAARLDGLSPLSVLSRGYAVALGPSGSALLRASDVSEGDAIVVRLHDGSLRARVTST